MEKRSRNTLIIIIIIKDAHTQHNNIFYLEIQSRIISQEHHNKEGLRVKYTGFNLPVYVVNESRHLRDRSKLELLTLMPEIQVFSTVFLFQEAPKLSQTHGVSQQISEAEAPHLHTALC